MAEMFWNDPIIILWILIAILIVDNFWSLYLQLRQIRVYNETTEVPEELKAYLPEEPFLLMRKYRRARAWLAIWQVLIFVVICGVLELYFGFYPILWKASKAICYAAWAQHEIIPSFVFLMLLNLYFILKAIPAAFYQQYFIHPPEERIPIPFCRKILGLLCDILVSILLMLSLSVTAVLTVQYLGKYFFIGIYGFLLATTVVLILIMPLAIGPFLGKQRQLEHGPLRRDIERLTDSTGFPISKVRIVETNDPNMGSNAFFYGFGCLRRLVIFDSLLYNRGISDTSALLPNQVGKGLKNELVVAVVAHELGHWRHGHFYKATIVFQLHLMIAITLLGLIFFHSPIYQAVGFQEGVEPIVPGVLIMIGYVLVPYFTLANFFMLSMTRYFEFQADEFAFDLGYSKNLRAALLKLYADNLSFPSYDSCYSAWNHTHPTMLERLQRLRDLEEDLL